MLTPLCSSVVSEHCFFQTLHPIAMRGVAEHSDYEHDPLGRLQRTASFLGKTTYGTGAEANEAINLVRSIHSRVEGTMPDGDHLPGRRSAVCLVGCMRARSTAS